MTHEEIPINWCKELDDMDKTLDDARSIVGIAHYYREILNSKSLSYLMEQKIIDEKRFYSDLQDYKCKIKAINEQWVRDPSK